MAIALGSNPERGGLLGGPSFGEALARANVAELRVLRLLDAEPDQLADLLRHSVRQLVSHGQPFDPREIADLVTDPRRADGARRTIARNFYRHLDA
jgi:predicted HD phosphohydrolase